MGLEKDLPPGEQLVTLFRPFLEHLAASNLSPKTIQKHVDNMWVLGGEFIRDLHNDPPLRKRPVDQVLSKMIEYGGPLLYHGGEDQQRSFDSTCRKFRRFLIERLADARLHPQIPPTRHETNAASRALVATLVATRSVYDRVALAIRPFSHLGGSPFGYGLRASSSPASNQRLAANNSRVLFPVALAAHPVQPVSEIVLAVQSSEALQKCIAADTVPSAADSVHAARPSSPDCGMPSPEA